MNELLEFLNQNYAVKAFGLSLLHSLWQGMAIAALLWLLLKIGGQLSARIRYRLAFAALCSLLLCFVATLVMQLNSEPIVLVQMEEVPTVSLTEGGTETAMPAESTLQQVEVQWILLINWVHKHIAYFFLAWSVGFVVFSFRFFTGLFYLRNLKQQSTPLPKYWLEKVKVLKHKLGLHKEIHLIASAKVPTPITFGWLKPVIVFPLSMLSLLPEEQVESILLHELAHIQRNDYLVNLLQSIIEITFFFNPGYWYISRVLELEREHVCDDMVVANSANSHTYALALTNLASLSTLGNSRLAMGIAKQENSLLFRIKRIIHPSKPERMQKSVNRKSYQLASLIIACVLLVFLTIDVKGTSGQAESANNELPRAIGADSTITVEGAVWDKHGGAGLPGVAVTVKGTTIGTATDMAGNYSIRAQADDTLLFSFVGFHKKEVAVNQQNFHMIVLESIEKVTDSRLVIHDLKVTQHEDDQDQANIKIKGHVAEAEVPTSKIILLPEDEDIKIFMKYITKEEVQLKDIEHRGREITAAELEAIDQSMIKSNLTLSSEETGHKKAVTLVKLKKADDKVAVISSKSANIKPLFVLLEEGTLGSVKGEPLDYKAAFAQGKQVTDISELNRPADIASIHVLKGEQATELLGEAGKNGVVFITLKDEAGKKVAATADKEEEGLVVFPNPSTHEVKVRFYSAVKQQVRIDALNPNGTKVHTFVNGVLDEGWHQYEWNAAKQQSGIYNIILTKGSDVKTTKLILE